MTDMITAPPQRGKHGGARPGAGRKKLVPNRLNRDIATYLRRRGYETHGREPLELDYELANRPMATDRGELQAFAEHLGCSRLEAFREWRAIKKEVYPRIYPSLASITVKPAGSPGSGELAPVEGELPQTTAELVRGPDGVFQLRSE